MTLRARLHKSNIVKVESLRASMRRRIQARSIQTHGQDFADLCGEWLCDRIRNCMTTSVHFESGAVGGKGNDETAKANDESE